MDLMPPGSSHVIAFLPSISPTSSREESRQCARMMANKGHQCHLIEYPGFHTDPHINNRVQQTFVVDDDGIHHLKENLSMGIEDIELPEQPLRSKPTTSMPRLAIAFTKARCKLWKQRLLRQQEQQQQSIAAGDRQMIGTMKAVDDGNSSKTIMDCHLEDEKRQSEATANRGAAREAMCSGSLDPATAQTSEADRSTPPTEDSIPYNHIHRSFMRQYIRFLLLQWGAGPLSVVAIGQSLGFFLQALDDLIELGRGKHHVEVLAAQLTPGDWRYTADGRRIEKKIATEEGGRADNGVIEGIACEEQLACHDGGTISKAEACEMLRDAVVADLIRMHMHTAIFASPFWKSAGRTYFEEMGLGFTKTIQKYLMAKVCNFWTSMSLPGDYWKQRRFTCETFAKYGR